MFPDLLFDIAVIMRIKKLAFQSGLFMVLLLGIEVYLRIQGHQPGLLNKEIHPIDTLIYKPLFRADENGLVTFVAGSSLLPEGYVINKQGFRSSFDFDRPIIDSLRTTGDKVVFLIGDSYTEGCCASRPENSFADLLAQDSSLVVLNFGVGTTGLVNYELVLTKYAAELKPDLVVLNFYCGNDIEKVEEPTKAGGVLFYTVEGLPWLRSVGPPHFMDDENEEVLSSPEKAYQFYIKNYTLWSDNVSLVEKLIRRSVLMSKMYLGVREKAHMASWAIKSYELGQDVHITNALLTDIAEFCHDNQTQLLISCIPAPKDVKRKVVMEEKYAPYFEGVEHVCASTNLFSVTDFDGMASSNHFNDSGHAKYANFLQSHINDELQHTHNYSTQ